MAVVGALAFVVLAVLLVPWDPIPGGPLHPPSASSVFTAEQIQRAEDYSGTQRLLSWASLAVSLAVACVLGFTRIGARFVDRVRGPWWWRVVVAVAALAVVGRLATLPFSIVLRHRALEFGLTNQAWGAYAVDLAKGLGGGGGGHLDRAGGAGRRRPSLAARLARGRRPAPGRAGDARLVRLPAAGRAAVQPLRTAAGRPAPHPDPRAGRPGGRAGGRRAGGRRVATHDHAERLRVRLRVVAPGGRLRQPRRRRRRPRDPLRRRPRAGPCAPRRRAHRLAARRGRRPARRRAARAAGRGTGAHGRPAAGAPGAGAAWRSRRCSPARCRTASAGASRPGPTWTRCGPPTTRRRSSRCRSSWRVTSLADPTPYAWSQFWFGSHPTTLQRIALAERVGRTGSSEMHVTPRSRAPRGEGSVCWLRIRGRCRATGPRRCLAAAVEQAARATAEGEDRDDDQGGDAGDQEAVLDGRRTALVAAASLRLVHGLTSSP